MAVVNSQDEDENGQPQSGSSPVKSGVVNLSEAPVSGSPTSNTNGISSGTSDTSVNTATPGSGGGNTQANSSGSWTNLNDYLAANNSGNNNLGSRVLNTVNTAATQGAGIIDSAGQNFQGDVTAGTDVYNPKLSSDALASPTSFLQGPEYSQLVNELTGTYNGPSDWGTSTEAANATAGQTQSEQTAGLGLTSQGRQQILNQTAASPYTQGQSSLNEFLLDNNPSQLQPITQAANIGGNLQGQYQQVAQNAGTQVTAGQNTSAATGTQATGDILGGQTALIGQLTNQAQKAQADTTSQGQTIGSLLNSNSPINDSPPTQTSDGVPNSIPAPQLTSAEISSLGITPDQYNQLIALNQQVIGLGAPGINFGSFYTAPDVSGLTPAAEATSGQVSDFNALNQLVPGSNQQFLNGATGSPATANGGFNYQNAVLALQAQLSAAQQAATQTQTAQQATSPLYGGQSAAQVAEGAAAGLGGVATLINLGGKLYKFINGQYQPVTPDTPPINAAQQDAQPQADANAAAQQSNANLANPPDQQGADLSGLGAAAAGTAAGADGAAAASVPSTVSSSVSAVDAAGNPTDVLATSTANTSDLGIQGITSAIDNGATNLTATATADGGALVTDATGDTFQISAQDLAASDQAATDYINSVNPNVGTIAPPGFNVVGAVAIAYSLYSAINNYQSGATGPDALSGASVGASIGGYSWGPVGAAVGAVIGAAVGGLLSIAGGGKVDPETTQLYSYDAQYAQNPSIASNNTPAQNFQILTGVFDGKDPTPGHSTAIEQIFGRQGEGNFVSQMTAKINQAVTSGQIPPNASASQIYSQVVDPWLASYTGNYGGGQTTGQILPSDQDAQGNNLGNALVAAVEGLIGQWQTGQFNANAVVGVSDQTMTNLPVYAGASAFAPYVAPPSAVVSGIDPYGTQAQNTAQAATQAAATQYDTAQQAATAAPNDAAAQAAAAAAQQAAEAAYMQQLASQGYYG